MDILRRATASAVAAALAAVPTAAQVQRPALGSSLPSGAQPVLTLGAPSALPIFTLDSSPLLHHAAAGGALPSFLPPAEPSLQALPGAQTAGALPEAAVAAMSRTEEPEEDDGGRISRLFENSRAGLNSAGSFFQALARRENRESSLNAASYMLGVRDSHFLPSLSREQTVEAINTLRAFRLELGHPTADPAMRLALTASPGSSKRKVAAVARQVRGIERKGAAADPGADGPDSKEQHFLGVVAQGGRAIRDFHEDVTRSASALTNTLYRFPHEYNMRIRFMRSLVSPMTIALTPIMLFLGATLWPWIAAALTVINEPLSVARHRFGKDRFHRAASRRQEDFLKDGSAWRYDSKTYLLQGGLVNAILRLGKDPAGLQYPLWNQDYHGSHGLYSRLMKRFLLRRQAAQMAATAGERGAALDSWTRDEKDHWVTVDRLLWRRAEGGEPVMVMVVRTSTDRPKFPKPVTSRAWQESFQTAPELAPVTVPVRR